MPAKDREMPLPKKGEKMRVDAQTERGTRNRII
jgi:hypothetical protein